ncbi:MAG TPA: prolyl oligopeptidase family serine peptidase, partial [Blastocatellia bacterium]|nr:prolyl oligopeptidase family serine peptidase [Blastocatellia bacterium]
MPNREGGTNGDRVIDGKQARSFRLFRTFSLMALSLPLIIVCHSKPVMSSNPQRSPVSITDLVGYTRIRQVRISPDGKWVAYLLIKPQIADNRYQSTLLLQKTEPSAAPIELARFYTAGDQTYDRETGALKSFGGQTAWSADGRKLAYTKRVNDQVQLWIRQLDSGSDFKAAGDLPNAELTGWNEDGTTIGFKVSNPVPSLSGPPDPAVRVTDETNFWTPPWYSPPAPEQLVDAYRYHLPSGELTTTGDQEPNNPQDLTYEDAKWPTRPDEIKYALEAVLSPDQKKSVFLGMGLYHTREIEKAYQDFFVGISLVGAKSPPREFHHATSHIHDFRWSNDSRLIYGLLRDPEYTAVVSISAEDGEMKQLLKIDGSLTNLEWQADGTAFVATRQSSLMPDQLVKVDLAGGTTTVLADPNAAFAEKDRPRIRFMRINNPLGGGIHGRLVLPNGYVQGRRYPLIFTTYLAGPEFLEGAVGDEFPILPFAANGFAVFVMDAELSNMRSDFGDLEFTLMMYKRPLDAMETVRQQLTAEGIIDPERCAITGLSYGSDIAVYALSRSKFFKAA